MGEFCPGTRCAQDFSDLSRSLPLGSSLVEHWCCEIQHDSLVAADGRRRVAIILGRGIALVLLARVARVDVRGSLASRGPSLGRSGGIRQRIQCATSPRARLANEDGLTTRSKEPSLGTVAREMRLAPRMGRLAEQHLAKGRGIRTATTANARTARK